MEAITTASLFELWHEFRLPILAVVGITIAFLKLLSYRKNAAIPRSPTEEKFVDLPVQSDGVVVLPETRKLDRNAPLSQTHAKPTPTTSNSNLKPKKAAKQAPKRITGDVRRTKKASKTEDAITAVDDADSEPSLQIYVFYSSLTGSTEKYAKKFAEDLFSSPAYTPSPAPPTNPINTPPPSPSLSSSSAKILPPIVHNVDYLDLDDYFISHPHSSPSSSTKAVYLILLPTYEIESPVDAFLQHLEETHHDFRIDSRPLRNIAGFAVFGFGDKEGWPDDTKRGSGMFCGQARDCDRWMGKLSGNKRLFPIGMGDVKTNAQESLDEWRVHLEVALKELAQGGVSEASNADNAVDSEDEEDVAQDEPAGEKLVDVEDIGDSMRKNEDVVLVGGGKRKGAPIPVDFTTTSKATSNNVTKQMVAKDSPTYNALTKQGYTIVGSHSGVKLCRWTKSALRGRGSCYKFSFYGIKSHLCMETTPSLSCSNKCVFCWRHGTNPVSTTWRWVVDPPADILRGVMEGHYKKIKMMKGIPGVRAERFAEAFTIRHCALSLVGEPIFYPHINELLAMLHERHISSFLVCNAQHPEQLAALKYVTQLYVSIDASNKESLRRIDRPLHRDFWERFQRCLEILRAKRNRMRTVFRLTLVKGFNVDEEVEGYADLVSKGLPSFVEIKGVTYCGTSTSVGAGLTMANVPFYEEVADFVVKLNDALKKRGLSYGIAAEHAHSCCVLIASNDFYIDGKWRTIIDYKRFFELLESGEEFGPLDYVGPPTPEWANWGNGGFDPADQRHYRKGKGKNATAATEDSCQPAGEEMEAESGCG